MKSFFIEARASKRWSLREEMDFKIEVNFFYFSQKKKKKEKKKHKKHKHRKDKKKDKHNPEVMKQPEEIETLSSGGDSSRSSLDMTN